MSQQSSSPSYYASTDVPSAYPTQPFNTWVAVGAITFFFVLLFILLLHLYARWFLHRSYSIGGRHAVFSSLGASASAPINTGLDKSVIAQLPTFVYTAISPVNNLAAGQLAKSVARPTPECVVCLSEFQENEKVRMLPACKHIFHTDCIDMWFFSHCTCPLCRTEVVPAMATSASTRQQHQGAEAALEPSLQAVEGDIHAGSHLVEYPCNVLFWGNQAQVVSLQEPASSSSFPSLPSLPVSGARVLPQITIDIPPIEGSLLVSASGRLSAKCTPVEEEVGVSQLLVSPGVRTSIKRMLSRQSSRQKTTSQEVSEESRKQKV